MNDCYFTTQCTGDLAVAYEGIVIAMLFHTPYNYNMFHVYDVRKGGAPTEFRLLPDALAAMNAIAEEHKEDVHDDLIVQYFNDLPHRLPKETAE